MLKILLPLEMIPEIVSTRKRWNCIPIDFYIFLLYNKFVITAYHPNMYVTMLLEPPCACSSLLSSITEVKWILFRRELSRQQLTLLVGSGICRLERYRTDKVVTLSSDQRFQNQAKEVVFTYKWTCSLFDRCTLARLKRKGEENA